MTSRIALCCRQTRPMKLVKSVVGFVPFVLFSVLLLFTGAGTAAGISALVAAAVVIATRRDGIKIVPAAQGVLLLGVTTLSVTGGPGVDAILIKYAAGAVALLLGLFLVASAAAMPFTAQLSRSTVPEAAWHSPQFLQVNRRISTAWGSATIVLGICHLAGAETGNQGGQLVLRLAINWVVPVVACLVANAYTKHQVAQARQLIAQAHHRMQEKAA